MKAILFTNWTDEDFSWKWDGVIYEFPAKQSIHLPEYQAEHFSKHLVDREMNKLKIRVNDPIREELKKKCFSGESMEAQDEASLQVRIANAKKEAKEEEKSMRTKKGDDEDIKEEAKARKQLRKKLEEEDKFEGKKK
jgi:hypothetical protein